MKIVFTLLFWSFLACNALASEDPDELYRQGRFAEAEQAYADSDMDHPKDLRFRYNRGCSAYQNSDYRGSMAAFSSVLRRAEDDETRFKAAYNLGNTAFEQNDYLSAATHYKLALQYSSESDDARYNLELALREHEKQKKSEQEKQDQQKTDQPGGEGDQAKSGKKEEDSEKGNEEPSSEENSEQQSSQEQKEQDSQAKRDSEQNEASEREEKGSPNELQEAKQNSPQDLSGDLKPREALPEGQEEAQSAEAAISMIDKKKAEALLDNIKEDRSRFLRFQIPEDKRHGVSSGRDW